MVGYVGICVPVCMPWGGMSRCGWVSGCVDGGVCVCVCVCVCVAFVIAVCL